MLIIKDADLLARSAFTIILTRPPRPKSINLILRFKHGDAVIQHVGVYTCNKITAAAINFIYLIAMVTVCIYILLDNFNPEMRLDLLHSLNILTR
jgi:hypothetical protein